MKIWFLVRKGLPPTYSRMRFKEEAQRLGFTVKQVHPEDFEIIEPLTPSSDLVYKGKKVRPPDVLIARMGSFTSYFALSVIRQFERMGVFVLNSSTGIENAKDKLRTIQILASNHLPIPKTMLAKFPLDIEHVKKEFDFPVVLKVLSGNKGRGVVLCETPDQLEDICDLHADSSGGNPNLIVQEFISHQKGKDIRVLVLGGKVVGAMMRSARPGQFKSNFSAGGSVEVVPVTPQMEQLALGATDCVGLRLAGVDILMDKEGYRVCEVNSSPGFEGFERATGINVPERLFEFIKTQLGENKKGSRTT